MFETNTTQTSTIIPTELLSILYAWLPRLLTAIALLVFGWLLAHLFKAVTKRLVQLSWNYSQKFRFSQTQAIQYLPTEGRHLLAKTVYWLTILVFAALAANALQLTLFTSWVNTFLNYLPNLIVALLILFGGLIFGEFVKDAVVNAAEMAKIKDSLWLGRIAEWTVIGASILIGTSQLGINITLLTNITTIAFGALFGAFAIGLALGAPTHVSNFMSARYVQRVFKPGDHIKIGDHHGVIIEISTYSIIVDSEAGQLHLPAKMFVEFPCLKIDDEK